jgi:hypothetical protein
VKKDLLLQTYYRLWVFINPQAIPESLHRRCDRKTPEMDDEDKANGAFDDDFDVNAREYHPAFYLDPSRIIATSPCLSESRDDRRRHGSHQ